MGKLTRRFCVPSYKKLPPAYEDESAGGRATSTMAKLAGKRLHTTNKAGIVVLTADAQLAVRAAEGALVTAGLLAPSSMMRTRFIAEIVELCATMPMDEPRLTFLWRY